VKRDKDKILKVAITGPESTGKSTLSDQLADHYHTVSTVEYARSYLHQLNRPYERHDLLKIAKGQIEEENSKLLHANRMLFCDTDLVVIKIWSMYKYGVLDPFIEAELGKQHYDIYLLTDIDLPWYPDVQREHPDKREYFFKLFRSELEAIQANYHIISGSKRERLHNAIRVVDDFFSRRTYGH
jgi:NadR type nicotinamide-nucleotide adenylyltransferase